MKKNIDRILIMFGFLAMLIMIFFMCARGGKTEPFIRTYDLIQDAIIEPMKNFTDSIQDGTGNINADNVEIDTLQINNNIIGNYTIEYDSILNKVATDTAEWSKINNIPTIYFTVSNSNQLFADTTIIDDTTIITDTGCFVIYGDSYGINLDSYTVSYQVYFDTGMLAGTWGQSSLLSYLDKPRNRYVIKSGVNNFAINTIETTFKRRK